VLRRRDRRLAGQLSTDPQRRRVAGSDPGRWLETARTAATSCPDVLLAIEDTTSVSYAHAVAADLGTTGSRREAKHRGYLVHPILLLEAAGERTIGLIEQRHWSRDAAEYGKKHARKQRAYADQVFAHHRVHTQRSRLAVQAIKRHPLSACRSRGSGARTAVPVARADRQCAADLATARSTASAVPASSRSPLAHEHLQHAIAGPFEALIVERAQRKPPANHNDPPRQVAGSSPRCCPPEKLAPRPARSTD